VVPDAAIWDLGLTRFADDPANLAWLGDRRDSSVKELLKPRMK
jgi:hypothetical protein